MTSQPSVQTSAKGSESDYLVAKDSHRKFGGVWCSFGEKTGTSVKKLEKTQRKILKVVGSLWPLGTESV